MRNILSLCVVVSLSAARIASTADAPSKEAKAEKTPAAKQTSQEVLKTEKQKISYFLGMNLAKGMKAEGIDVDVDIMAMAMKHVLSGGEVLFSDEQARQIGMEFQKQRGAQMKQRQQEVGSKNKTAGDAFLAENKKKPGVVTTPSGLQYKVITAGSGQTPKASDTVTVHYRGTLTDGTEFDSSHKRGEPATFPVSGVIKGWTEVLQLMKVGSKYHVFIPSELAYGERGAGNVIGPNAVLIFEVELLGIKPSEAEQK